MKITEDNFIEELEKRNEKALDYIIDNYGWVINTVMNKQIPYLREYHEECFNDCLLGIWENISFYDSSKSSFKNWMGVIARYKSIDYIRKYGRYIGKSDIDNYNFKIEDKSIENLLEEEINEKVKYLLSFLSEEDQFIFKKFYFEDRTAEEISEKINIKKENIYNRLSRGRRKIRRKFQRR